MLCSRYMKLALEWFHRKQLELLARFDLRHDPKFCDSPDPTIIRQLQESHSHLGSLLDVKMEAFDAAIQGLPQHSAHIGLRLWKAYRSRSGDCEVCKIQLLGLMDRVTHWHCLLGALISRQICNSHEYLVENLFEIAGEDGELDALHARIFESQDLDLRSWSQLRDKRHLFYLPDSALKYGVASTNIRTLLREVYLWTHVDVFGRTWLHQILDSDGPIPDIETADLTLPRPAYNVQDCFGRTPLYIACQQGIVPAVQQLLLGGADPTILSRFGFLPIHVAAARGSPEICQLLRNYSYVRIDALDSDGKTARDHAVINHHFATADVLFAESEFRMQFSPRREDMGLLEDIYLGLYHGVDHTLKNGADPNALFDSLYAGGRIPGTADSFAESMPSGPSGDR